MLMNSRMKLQLEQTSFIGLFDLEGISLCMSYTPDFLKDQRSVYFIQNCGLLSQNKIIKLTILC